MDRINEVTMPPEDEHCKHDGPVYRMYVDEFGDAQIKNFEKPNTQFLGVTGVVLNLEAVATTLHPESERIKSKYFPTHHPDSPVIFHRTDMVRKRGHFAPLRDDALRFWFDMDLQSFIQACNPTVITVAIDKQAHCQQYTDPDHPYHYVMTCLIERYTWFLNRKDSRGDVLVESRNPNQNTELNREYSKICDDGTWLVKRKEIDKRITSKELKFRTKGHNILGTQVADLIGKASMGEMLEKKKVDIECGEFDSFIAQLLKDTAYFRDRRGSIDNYGMKWVN